MGLLFVGVCYVNGVLCVWIEGGDGLVKVVCDMIGGDWMDDCGDVFWVWLCDFVLLFFDDLCLLWCVLVLVVVLFDVWLGV